MALGEKNGRASSGRSPPHGNIIELFSVSPITLLLLLLSITPTATAAGALLLWYRA
jgi:hypothetical protein